jgi:hypothetical protein
VHEQRNAHLDGRVHGGRAHGVHLHVDARFLAFVEDGAQHVELLLRRPWNRRQRDLARVVDAHRGHLADLFTRRIRRVIREPDALRRNDARPVDEPGLDVLASAGVAVAGAAARKHRGVARLEQALHLRFLVRARVDVLVGIDESGHGRHAAGVDRLAARSGRRAGADRRDLAVTHDDRAALDDRAVADDDADIGDREVLGGKRRGRRQREPQDE